MSQEDQESSYAACFYHICFSSPREVIEKMLQLKANMEAALIRIKVTQVMRIWAWNDVLYSLIIS